MRRLAPVCLLPLAACYIEATGLKKRLDVPEDRGVLVASDNWMGRVSQLGAISGDLYYQVAAVRFNAPPTYELRAVHLADLASRTVHGPQDGLYTEVALSADEQQLYFSPWVSNDVAPVYAHAMGAATVAAPELLTNTRGLWQVNGDGIGSHLLSSPDGSTLAYIVASDSLYVYTRSSRERRFVTTGCLAIAAFAPDGGTVLCGKRQGNDLGFGTAGYSMVSLGSGAVVPLSLPKASVGEYAAMFRWDALGIRVLYREVFDYFIADLAAGTSRRVIPAADTLDSPFGTNIVWSPDGELIAFWSGHCMVGFCQEMQEKLIILRLSDSSTRVAAVVNHGVNTDLRTIGFTPGNTHIVYNVDNHIYMKAL